jgi:hypothetical protein
VTGPPWGLPAAWSHARRGRRSSAPGTVVLLPSYSVAGSLLSHYADRLLLLEHRHLLHVLTLARTSARMVFVTSGLPTPAVVDYYMALVPAARRRDVRSRLHFFEVPDPSARSVTAKLLDRPDLIGELRRLIDGAPAYIEPWNVTWDESRLAQLLDLPLYGTPPELWPLGFKSSGRRILRSAGVAVPAGREDVRSADDVAAAVEEIARRDRSATGAVVKIDNSGAGDGNRVLLLGGGPPGDVTRRAVASWEPWYREELARGAVVEELVAPPDTTFPSVQGVITPTGAVRVVSTHEQILGGPQRQLYQGCVFPAVRGYASRLAEHGEAVGRRLAGLGALGRFSVDFAAAPTPGGGWQLYGLEINLRTTGTTHPLAALASLAPGRYEPSPGRWRREDGSERCYRSTDNLLLPAWRGNDALGVVDSLGRAGVLFDRASRTGVVLHGFCGLGVDGRLGVTAIGSSDGEAAWLYQQAEHALGAQDPHASVQEATSRSPGEGDAIGAWPV